MQVEQNLPDHYFIHLAILFDEPEHVVQRLTQLFGAEDK